MNIAIIGDVHINKFLGSRTDDYLEACINKLEQVLQNNDFVFCLGDMFHATTIDLESLSKVYTLFKSYRSTTDIVTIIGNHDCYNMNENSLYRTSLGFLELLGVIKILRPNDYFEVGEGLCFKALPLNFKDIQPDKDECFFLGHHYYGLNCADSLSEDMLKEYYPNSLGFAFGHEHQPFPTIECNGVNIYRPGSLLRNAATDYNKKENHFTIRLL